MTIFRPGENCQQVCHSDQVRCLIDGEQYFSQLRQSLMGAQRQVLILAWDINSRFPLIREAADDPWPVELLPLLNALTDARPELEVYILSWDFAPLLALDREWMPRYQFEQNSHERVHFEMAESAPGSSHHQKVVVIDDALAFCGGMDITAERWDTSEHRYTDDRRIDHPGDDRPRPYHDIQMMVTGECARTLAAMARQRWLRATGQSLPSVQGIENREWIHGPPHFNDVRLAMSLTQSSEKGTELQQVEQLYLDMIEQAQHYIYIENQYLTANRLVQALEQKLRASQGPEIVIVLPFHTHGWLSQYTMDLLRSRAVRQLQQADCHQRLLISYPSLPEENNDSYLNVHAKVMIVDDYWLRIGSANLNNRSMGLDSECDLTLESGNETQQQQIRALRNTLLAEHLGVTQQQIEAADQNEPPLLQLIQGLSSPPRTLKELAPALPLEQERALPESRLLDPEAPVDRRHLQKMLLPAAGRREISQRLLLVSGFLAVFLALIALWQWSPLAQQLTPGTIQQWIQPKDPPLSVLLPTVSIIVIAGLIGIPVTLMIIASMLIFGSFAGGLLALTGLSVSAAAAYMLGQMAGRKRLRRMAGPRVGRISQQMSEQGVLSVFVIRLLPIAPFVMVNLVAGLSHIRLRDFMIGTLFGLLPGTIALGLVTESVLHAAQQPGIEQFLQLGGLILAIIGGGVLLYRWLRPESE